MSQLIGFMFSMIWLVIIVTVVIVALIVPQYNKLKVLAEGVNESFSNILVSMQKRADLANKLQDIASTYAKDEQFTMLTVAKEDNLASIVDAYRDSFQAVNVVNAVAQRYPQLKSNTLYQTLMSDLTGLENELQKKREAFNACVRFYNSPLKQFPTVIYAPRLGLGEAPYWQSDDPESLNKLKEFKTDDARVRELVAQAGNRAANLTRQGVSAVKSRVEKGQAARSQGEEANGVAVAKNEEPPAVPSQEPQ